MNKASAPPEDGPQGFALLCIYYRPDILSDQMVSKMGQHFPTDVFRALHADGKGAPQKVSDVLVDFRKMEGLNLISQTVVVSVFAQLPKSEKDSLPTRTDWIAASLRRFLPQGARFTVQIFPFEAVGYVDSTA